MAWIKEIEIAEAEGLLAKLYKQLLRPDGDVAHILHGCIVYYRKHYRHICSFIVV